MLTCAEGPGKRGTALCAHARGRHAEVGHPGCSLQYLQQATRPLSPAAADWDALCVLQPMLRSHGRHMRWHEHVLQGVVGLSQHTQSFGVRGPLIYPA